MQLYITQKFIDFKIILNTLICTGGTLMHTESIKRITIQKEINLIPENRLDEVKIYIETILNQNDIKKPKPLSLKGIWKDKNFTKIKDLETEISDLRKNLSNSILNKKL